MCGTCDTYMCELRIGFLTSSWKILWWELKFFLNQNWELRAARAALSCISLSYITLQCEAARAARVARAARAARATCMALSCMVYGTCGTFICSTCGTFMYITFIHNTSMWGMCDTFMCVTCSTFTRELRISFSNFLF